ncbi:MAG: hypothetical protein AAF970_01745 [Bacteroidota bacterium]
MRPLMQPNRWTRRDLETCMGRPMVEPEVPGWYFHVDEREWATICQVVSTASHGLVVYLPDSTFVQVWRLRECWYGPFPVMDQVPALPNYQPS